VFSRLHCIYWHTINFIDKASMLALGMSVQLFGGTPQDTQKYSLYVNPAGETFNQTYGRIDSQTRRRHDLRAAAVQ
jgi:hypothetical protein